MPRSLIPIEKCPTCGGPKHPKRHGVKLTPLLAMIYDRIKIAGNDGIETSDLRSYLEDITGRKGGYNSVSMNILRINNEFKADGVRYRICCRCCYSATHDDRRRECTSYYYLAKL